MLAPHTDQQPLHSSPIGLAGTETAVHMDIVAVGMGHLVLQKEKHHPVILLSLLSDLWIPLSYKCKVFTSFMVCGRSGISRMDQIPSTFAAKTANSTFLSFPTGTKFAY